MDLSDSDSKLVKKRKLKWVGLNFIGNKLLQPVDNDPFYETLLWFIFKSMQQNKHFLTIYQILGSEDTIL